MSHFPFTAVLGSEQLKLALILNAIDSNIGGVLISGPRGSGKSTLARALPDIAGIDQSHFVNLPLGATEERIVGTLNIEKVIKKGEVAFTPGLLHRAHQGILYVDEVNLLPDHLVDLLLDVAASGMNHIERDGISHNHPAKFMLIGTMNPDEGELRPQLLDRFGLCVSLSTELSVEQRVQVMQRRVQYDEDAKAFLFTHKKQQEKLCSEIVSAKQQLTSMVVEPKYQQMICEICADANVEGLRADITLLRAAKAYSAWQQLDSVEADSINTVKELVLMHRQQEVNSPPKNSKSASQNVNNNSPAISDEAGNNNSDTSTNNSDGDWGQMPPVTSPIGKKRDINEAMSKSDSTVQQKKKTPTTSW